jgi:hypothetical protein
MVVSRVWDEYFRRTGAKFLKDPDNADQAAQDDAVTFPCPLRETPGKHGRGLSRWDGSSKPSYIVQILYQLQQEKILHYFDIQPSDEDPGNPANYKTVVKAGVEITDPNGFLKGFTPREVRILIDMGTALRKLGPSEIRALGTHENSEKTLVDIEKEFQDLERRLIWEEILAKLQAGESFSDEAEEFVEYAEEAWRKSVENFWETMDTLRRPGGKRLERHDLIASWLNRFA